MTTPPPPGNITYQVTTVLSNQYGPDAAGNSVEGHRVGYKLSNGQESSVFIPGSQFNEATVEQAIQNAARTMVAVKNISGTL